MNAFIKSVPMPLALFHKSKRGFQASDWNTLGVPSEPMAEAVCWDCQARRYETWALFLEQAVGLLSFAALASLLAGLAVLAGVLLLRPCDAACGIRAGAGSPSSARPAPDRTDPRSTARSSAVSAGRDGTIRSRWTRTTGRAPARVTPWTCPGRFPPRSSGRPDAARNAASRSGSFHRTTGANIVGP